MMKKITFISIGLFAFLALGLTSCSGGAANSESENDSTVVNTISEDVSGDTVVVVGESDMVLEPDSIELNKGSEVLGTEYTAKYICPNHCKGSGSDKEGECSNSDCGMDLMENPNYKK